MKHTKTSYPKEKIRTLLLENIHESAKQGFEQEGYPVESLSTALTEDELIEQINDVSIVGIRSKTQITKRVLEHADKLLAVGAFCIGTNQIDLKACAERGVAVFNAPYSNTRSVVELAMAEIVMLFRRTFERSTKMHAGIWDKSANGSYEVRGKKLGIVGYGNIGSQLSIIAESMGMHVYYYDIVDRLALGNAQKCRSLEDLLGLVDVVTLHIDGRAENERFFGEKEFDAMRDGAYFLNLSRGFVIDAETLADRLRRGVIAGAAVDVFPEEPKNNEEEFISPLRGMPNAILTPHIGGSTAEAQAHIAGFVPQKIISYINTGDSFGSVNFPNIQLPAFGDMNRIIHIHRNMPGVLAQVNDVFAKKNINITGQYLKTNETIGYVITDVDKNSDESVMRDLRSIPHTIKSRILY
jgi:D-3-phosphoglycerate dehydrogenase